MNAVPDVDVAHEYEALLQFLYLAPVGLAQCTLDGEIAFINPLSAQLLMPLARDAGLTNLFTALESVAPDLRHLVEHFAAPSGMICDSMNIQLYAGESRAARPGMLSLSLVKLDQARLMAVISDITQQVKRERLLRQNEAWLNAILTGITDYVVVSLDKQGIVLDCSAGIDRVTGFTAAAVLGKPYSIFYPEGATTPDRMRDRLHEAHGSGWSLDDGWRVKSDGTRYWGSAMIAPLNEPRNVPQGVPQASDNEAAYCLIIRDITDKRAASESLWRATSSDHLTGIANRRAFFAAGELETERWRRSPRPLSLIMFDADHFKNVNDTWGHAAGDAVLCNLATTLTQTFRQVDVVARVGGEEFAVLLPSTGIEGALKVAKRVQRAIEAQAVTVGTHAIRYTVSGGVATMDTDVSDLDGLMKRADVALYAAKSHGRNCVES